MPKPKLDWNSTKEHIRFNGSELLMDKIKAIFDESDKHIDYALVDLFAFGTCVVVENYMNSRQLPTDGEIKAGMKELEEDIRTLLNKIFGMPYVVLSVETAVQAEKEGTEWTLNDTLLKLDDMRKICRDHVLEKRVDRKLALALMIMQMFNTLLKVKPTIYDRGLYAKVLSACFSAADHGVVPNDLLRIMSKANKQYPDWENKPTVTPEQERAIKKYLDL